MRAGAWRMGHLDEVQSWTEAATDRDMVSQQEESRKEAVPPPAFQCPILPPLTFQF